jgi:serine/threonine protein kinase
VTHRCRFSQAKKLGPYEILAPIGKGGMGEVNKARDTRPIEGIALQKPLFC